MQSVSSVWAPALTGSHRTVSRADVWYDGKIVAVLDDQILDGQVQSSDDGSAIRDTLRLSVASDDGSLVPRSEYAALAPYGSRVNVRAGLAYAGGGNETVSLGWFRLEDSQADEHWRIYDRPAGDRVVVSGGAQIDVTGTDLAQVIKDWAFMAPEQPASLSSVMAEIARITQGMLTLADSPGVIDTPIWDTLTYERDRWSAVCDLAAILDAVPFINPNGQLQLRPDSLGASVWTVTSGNEDSILVDASPRLSRQGIFNGVVSKGTDDNNVPVQATLLEGDGPLRWNGPFGPVPVEISSPVAKDGGTAYELGKAHLTRHIYSRSFPIQVTCACNYALQVGDTVTLALPDRSLSGRVQSITWPLKPGPMTMTVVVPRSLFWSQWGLTR